MKMLKSCIKIFSRLVIFKHAAIRLALFRRYLLSLLLPIQALTVILVFALRPFVLIRFGGISAERLGHFTLNTELSLLEVELSQKLLPHSTICIWYLLGKPANYYLLDLWKRELFIVGRLGGYFLFGVYLLLKKLPFGEIHIISPCQHDRDILGLMSVSDSSIKLKDYEIQRGSRICETEFGIPRDAKIVVATIRDSSYLKTIDPATDYSYHDFRDSTAQNYLKAFQQLANAGYYVLRMGAVVNSSLKLEGLSTKIIDYATSGKRTEFLDIYLAQRCEFCISQGTGFDGLTNMFRKPILYVNAAPLGYVNTMVPISLAIFKEHYSRFLGRKLSVSEIFDEGLGYASRSSDFKRLGVELVENSPDQIAEACSEMLSLIQDRYTLTEREIRLQKLFWTKFKNKQVNKYPLHTNIRLKICKSFLYQNSYLLN